MRRTLLQLVIVLWGTILVGASAGAAELQPPPEIDPAAETRDATTTLRMSLPRETELSVSRGTNPQVLHSVPVRAASGSEAGYGYDDAENLVGASARWDGYRFAQKAGGAVPVRLGQAGESAVRGMYDIGPKATVEISGRTRILDGLNSKAVSEVKNVAYRANTQQLKDSLAYAQQKKLDFDLYVRGGANPTALSVPARDFLQGLPRNARVELRATLDAVAQAPPPQFSGGLRWHVMRAEMSGYYEARTKTPTSFTACSACWSGTSQDWTLQHHRADRDDQTRDGGEP